MLRRLRNLWRMSNVDIEKDETQQSIHKKLTALFSEKDAVIVDLSDPIDMFPNETDQ